MFILSKVSAITSPLYHDFSWYFANFDYNNRNPLECLMAVGWRWKAVAFNASPSWLVVLCQTQCILECGVGIHLFLNGYNLCYFHGAVALVISKTRIFWAGNFDTGWRHGFEGCGNCLAESLLYLGDKRSVFHEKVLIILTLDFAQFLDRFSPKRDPKIVQSRA